MCRQSGIIAGLTGLSMFLTRLAGFGEEIAGEEAMVEEGRSDLWHTSLTILCLVFGIVVMAYAVLLTTYIVVTFT